jgi:hypothetical protein
LHKTTVCEIVPNRSLTRLSACRTIVYWSLSRFA